MGCLSVLSKSIWYSQDDIRPTCSWSSNVCPQRPLPAESWEGVFNATALRTTCMQNPASNWITHPGWLDVGEDCLNLNVFTPEVRKIQFAEITPLPITDISSVRYMDIAIIYVKALTCHSYLIMYISYYFFLIFLQWCMDAILYAHTLTNHTYLSFVNQNYSHGWYRDLLWINNVFWLE